ncbi:MAG: cryptochrome/photolyase family protein [Burkholderiaceae bacterium]
MRHLILLLGDQWSLNSPALADFDPACDAVLMIEAPSEATVVWSHKARIVMFLSAMRHFAETLRARAWPLDYVALTDQSQKIFADRLAEALARHRPQVLKVLEVGEFRMQNLITSACKSAGVACHWVDDTHFMCSRTAFAAWAKSKRELRMEFFYREMRKRHNVLMQGAEPVGGQWNFDQDNRSSYPKKTGPGEIPLPAAFAPDAITREVIANVEQHFPDHPGTASHFFWPVTREQALTALENFIRLRLPNFGKYQDAMWTNTPAGWHSLLSAALNLHLLDPREVIAAAEQAYQDGHAPLEAVEGFIRQILGWREFIRGVYWLDMPAMREANHYDHQRDLPRWFWTGETHMACVRDCLQQTLAYGYAHHIQRLMVTGNFALLAELSPQQVEDWYLAIYVDAVEWVELPNVAGMALHACGPRFTSKPYVASGAYIHRQSNYCSGCRYDSAQRTGEQACPFTTLYWHFIERHAKALTSNPRTALMAKNLNRLSDAERAAIRQQAARMLSQLDTL